MEDLINHLPTKYMAVATFAWVAMQAAGRAWHGWTKAGGWRGVKNAWLFGTNAPAAGEGLTQRREDAKKETK